MPKDHVAILRKSSGLLEKKLAGEKKIESRWYTARFARGDQISADDTIYFKYAAMPIEAKAKVRRVIQFSDLTPEKVNRLWERYGKQIGISDTLPYIHTTKHKKYCILIYLEKVHRLHRPFSIDKRGFGNASA